MENGYQSPRDHSLQSAHSTLHQEAGEDVLLRCKAAVDEMLYYKHAYLCSTHSQEEISLGSVRRFLRTLTSNSCARS
ncbi:hypothetical protein CMI48_03395 [Candidatus Pacearchaeota archaeon]|jgi:hypothetical protein|nr:hypothetical protein [Candidatus Pacearchaeota archaeon]